MAHDRFGRRLSYVFLCATPFLVAIVATVRALRVQGVYHAIGGLLFTAISMAVWALGGRAVRLAPATASPARLPLVPHECS